MVESFIGLWGVCLPKNNQTTKKWLGFTNILNVLLVKYILSIQYGLLISFTPTGLINELSCRYRSRLFFWRHKTQIKSQISVFILQTHYSIDIFFIYIIKKQFTSLRTKMKQHRMIMSKIYNLNKYILFHAIK